MTHLTYATNKNHPLQVFPKNNDWDSVLHKEEKYYFRSHDM